MKYCICQTVKSMTNLESWTLKFNIAGRVQAFVIASKSLKETVGTEKQQNNGLPQTSASSQILFVELIADSNCYDDDWSSMPQ